MEIVQLWLANYSLVRRVALVARVCLNPFTPITIGMTAKLISPSLAKSVCEICKLPAFALSNPANNPPTLIYLCRHIVHAACALPDSGIDLPTRPEAASIGYLLSSENRRSNAAHVKSLGGKLSFAAAVRVRVRGCPVCEHKKGGVTSGMIPQRGVQMIPVTA